jgi:hypothetical protein
LLKAGRQAEPAQIFTDVMMSFRPNISGILHEITANSSSDDGIRRPAAA